MTMTYVRPTTIPPEKLKDRTLYRINARNLDLGVFSQETRGFIGLREKFGYVYPDHETVWDAQRGTAHALEELPEVLPADIYLGTRLPGSLCQTCNTMCEYNGKDAWFHLEPSDCTKLRPVAISNDKIDKWLHEMQAKYASPALP
jgi:hypothetical protein